MSPFKLGCTILPIGSFLSFFKTFLGSERDENFSLKIVSLVLINNSPDKL